jgi:2-phospho-L-lactate guanylyltransferase
MRIDSPATRSTRLAPSAPPSGAARVGSARPVAAVVIPIRAFARGGARLAGALSPAAREDLARRMADRVVAAAGPLPVVVVSSAPEVLAWAETRGVATAPDPGGLDAAVAAGLAWCANAGAVRAIVAHADLPRARPGALVRFAADAGSDVAVLVPCHRDDGTPVLTVPVHRPVALAYGPGSFRRHGARAREAGLGVKVVRDAELGFDLDLPEDLAGLDAELR